MNRSTALFVRIIISILTLSISMSMSAQTSQMVYQGKLVSTEGVGVNDDLPMVFRLYDAVTDGTMLWEETHNGVNEVLVQQGLFQVILGSINPIDLPFNEQYWLEITIDGSTLTPRVMLSSTPYSFTAAVCESVVIGKYIATINEIQPDSTNGNFEIIAGDNIIIREYPDSNAISISANCSDVPNPLYVGDAFDDGVVQVNGAGGNRVQISANMSSDAVVITPGSYAANGLVSTSNGENGAAVLYNENSLGDALRAYGNALFGDSDENEVMKVNANRTTPGSLVEVAIADNPLFDVIMNVNDDYGHADGLVTEVTGEHSAIKATNNDPTGNALQTSGKITFLDGDGNELFTITPDRTTSGSMLEVELTNDPLFDEAMKVIDTYGNADGVVSQVTGEHTAIGAFNDDPLGDALRAYGNSLFGDPDENELMTVTTKRTTSGSMLEVELTNDPLFDEAMKIIDTYGNADGVVSQVTGEHTAIGAFNDDPLGDALRAYGNSLFGDPDENELMTVTTKRTTSGSMLEVELTNDPLFDEAMKIIDTYGNANGIVAEVNGDKSAIKGINNNVTGNAGEFTGNLVVKNNAGEQVFKVDAEEGTVTIEDVEVEPRFSGNTPGESTLESEATGTNGTGITAISTATSGSGNGILGSTDACGDSASGVKGKANCSTGMGYGVYGISSSVIEGSAGVYGSANSLDLLGSGGNKYGVYGFTSTNQQGAGVYGHSKDGTSPLFGVKGYTESGDMYSAGVFGTADSTAGVYGTITSNADQKGAVTGHILAGTDGHGYGVAGLNESDADSSVGVAGVTVGTGLTFGVYGNTISNTDGSVAVLGVNRGNGKNYGVKGITSSTADSTAGVYGTTTIEGTNVTFGVRGHNPSVIEGSAGVYGSANSLDLLGSGGNKYGVYGFTSTNQQGAGVYGHSKDGTSPLFGVKGYTESGDMWSAGVFGTADSTAGVYGTITSNADQKGAVTGHILAGTDGHGYGVAGLNESDADSSVGVAGFTVGTGLAYGVYGNIVSNTDGSVAVLGVNRGNGKNYGVKGITSSTADSTSGVYGTTTIEGTNISYGVRGNNPTVIEGSAGVYGSANSLDLLGAGGNKYGVYGFTSTNQQGAGVYGHSKDGTSPLFGVKGYTESGDMYSAGVFGTADSTAGVYGTITSNADQKGAVTGHILASTAGIGYGVLGINESDVDSSNGVRGISSGSGVSFGIIGEIASSNPGASGVLGKAHADASTGVLGISGGATGHGVLSLGMFETRSIDGTTPLLLADPAYQNVKIYKSDGSVLTEFGGVDNKVAIQTINSTAKPTIPYNNFTIEGVAPITVTTNEHGITISADSVGGAVGDTVQAEFFIAGTDSANGGMIFRRENADEVIIMQTECFTDPLIDISTIDACSGIPAVMRVSYDGSVAVEDTFPKAAIKGIWSVNTSGWDSADTLGHGIMGYSRSKGYAGVYAIGDDSSISGYDTPVNGLYAVTNSVNSYGSAVRGDAKGASGMTYGVHGRNSSNNNNAAGVYGVMEPFPNNTANYGVHGQNSSSNTMAAGVYGQMDGAYGAGLLGRANSSTAYAGKFTGRLGVYYDDPEYCNNVFLVDPHNGKLTFFDDACGLKLVEWNNDGVYSYLDYYEGAYTRFFSKFGLYDSDSLERLTFSFDQGIYIDGTSSINCFRYLGSGTYAGDSIRFKSSGDGYFSNNLEAGNNITGTNLYADHAVIGDIIAVDFRGSASDPINLEADLDGTGHDITCDWLTVNNIAGHTVNGDLSVNTHMGLGGNLTVAGDLTVSGTKSFIEPHPLDKNKSIKFVCTEANQAIVEHRNTISLVGGYAEFDIPEEFLLVSEPGTFSVNVTPQTLDDPGRLGAVVENGKVKIRSHDASSDYKVAFTISAIRKGYKDFDPIVDK